MDQEIRNKLRNVVTQCRKLLAGDENDTEKDKGEIRELLEGKFGIFARGEKVTADPNAVMTHLSDEEQAARKDILDHYAHIKARGFKPKDALDQLIREIAFTHLNRLCAYKMMEAREVYVGGQKFREAVSRGVNSNGVKFYLAEHPEEERLFNTGHQDIAYRHFLDWLGGALSEEIGVLFNPNDPANRLYPRQKTLDEVLDLLNGGGIKAEETELREQWPQIWSQDETIGWVYQYFTPKELRDESRNDSDLPRNAYELAFRNQFFTPRYVVEFLTDNTLGRTWYEMRKGDTRLNDQCQYMVRRPTEIFLKEGEQSPNYAADGKGDLSQSELLKLPVHIPHRPKKDPRELKILDPACGSGHFLLYCFDLLLTIYEEAYADPDLGPALKKDYPTLDALKRDAPRLILAHNLHGIDIDLRASQIAALALWLRCQRAYQEMGLKKERPQITKSNFVCAEPMPGEEQMLKEFVGQLEPKVLGQVVEVVFDKMKLAGEAGSLLKIEEEIRDAVGAAKKQWEAGPLTTQLSLFEKTSKSVQRRFNLSDITDDQFFEQAEDRVIEALRFYAEKAQNGQRLQRRLFTEDAVRGFAFVDLCQKRYDVVLMNPPFGSGTDKANRYFKRCYGASHNDMAAAFVERASVLVCGGGLTGAITTRTPFFLSAFTEWRFAQFLTTHSVLTFADFGMGVLDAVVETACYTILHTKSVIPSVFIDCSPQRGPVPFSDSLRDGINELRMPEHPHRCVVISRQDIIALPDHVFAYDLPSDVRACFKLPRYQDAAGIVKQGLGTSDDFRFVRAFWEVRNCGDYWYWYAKGGSSRGFSLDLHLVVNFANNGAELWENKSESGNVRSNIWMLKETVNTYFFQRGLTFTYRSRVFAPELLPPGCIFGVTGMTIFPKRSPNDLLFQLGMFNSAIVNYLILSTCERYEPLFQASKINRTPWPTHDNDKRIADASKAILNARQRMLCREETSPLFTGPMIDKSSTLAANASSHTDIAVQVEQVVSKQLEVIDAVSFDIFDITHASRRKITDEVSRRRAGLVIGGEASEAKTPLSYTQDVLSLCFGACIGRWGLDKLGVEAAFDPFEKLSFASPMFRTQCDSEEPAILVDDENHECDVVKGVRRCLEIIWSSAADKIENEAALLLNIGDLREYFRRSGKSGFWDDHISRYSKSRRKAPIYWLLQSSKKNYALWLYYHRLDKDLLFKALVNYVEPKIRLETSRLESLRSQKAAAGDSGKEAKRLTKDMDQQDDFVKELRDFEDRLRRAANLHLEPDLNDGVVLNIAPLHELVPWKEAKKYWGELMEGQYEWSSIGKQLRQKGLVK